MRWWHKVSAAYWLTLFTFAFVWPAGWSLGVYEYIPGLREIGWAVGIGFAIEAVALINPFPGDTLSEVIRWLGRLKELFPLVWGIYGGIGLSLAVAYFSNTPVYFPLLKAAIIITYLAGLSGHFWFPPGQRPRKSSISFAFIGGMIHGSMAILCAVAPSGGLLLVLVTCSAIYQGATFFTLSD